VYTSVLIWHLLSPLTTLSAVYTKENERNYFRNGKYDVLWILKTTQVGHFIVCHFCCHISYMSSLVQYVLIFSVVSHSGFKLKLWTLGGVRVREKKSSSCLINYLPVWPQIHVKNHSYMAVFKKKRLTVQCSDSRSE
jgi:hypothetical protein